MKRIFIILIISLFLPTFLMGSSSYYKKAKNVVKLDDATVLFFDFESINGNEAHDLSQSHNNGTIDGATTVTDQYGQYLSFDGTNDYVNCGNDSSVNFGEGGDFSLSVWVMLTSSAGASLVFKGTGFPGSQFYGVRWSATGKFRFSIGGTDDESFADKPMVFDTQWHFIVGTFSRDGDLTTYLDGAAGTPVSISGIGDCDNTSDLCIGTINGESWHNGSIDEVRIFNRALSAQEISDIFESTRGNYGK